MGRDAKNEAAEKKARAFGSVACMRFSVCRTLTDVQKFGFLFKAQIRLLQQLLMTVPTRSLLALIHQAYTC